MYANNAVSAYIRRGDMTRTCDPLVPNQMRYQLRYTPKWIAKIANSHGFAIFA